MNRAVIPVHGWVSSLSTDSVTSFLESFYKATVHSQRKKFHDTGNMRRAAHCCVRWDDAVVSDFEWESQSWNFSPSVRVARGSAAREFREEARRLHDEEGCERIDVLAHSLGVQVVWGALQQMPPEERRWFDNLYLFAGAIHAHRSWWSVATGISGRIFNFSSCHDQQLTKWYQAANLTVQGRAAGVAKTTSDQQRLKGINTRLRNVYNIDRSEAGSTHNNPAFRPCVDEVSADLEARPPDPHGDWRDEFWWDPPPRFPATPTRKRTRGALTEIVQRALTAVPESSNRVLDESDIDGAPGPKTRKATKRFQKASGLEADGIVGQKTWDALVGEPAKFY